MTQGIVKIHNKNYKTVALRVNEFHKEKTENMRINTELVFHDDVRVVMKALVYDSDVVVGTGYGEEFRDSSKINKTSAMENAETSAIGRALACIGLGGEEYASADEVIRAISQQEEMEKKPEPDTNETKETPSEEWTSPPNDDELLDKVKENYKNISDAKWHQQILANFLETKAETLEEVVEAIKGLSGDKLKELAGYQKTKLESKGE